ncbi:MAG TPA: isoprenylcysteine carboxylmethyltransferase family protein [Pyrinomonadaceae bacterium]|nr:isoprenylcysteine carboxylmethyltransferase family protein [Pyrinomonadaceae bacterium]
MSLKNKRLLQRMRVPLGFLFGIVFLIFARPEPVTLIVGGAIGVAGILIRAWASGHIRKNQNLAVSGPYAYTRNPLYLGSFVLGLGFTIASGVWWLGLIFAVLFLGIYLPVMRVEAKDLIDIFGEDYKEYARRAPLFFPRITAYEKSDAKFDLELYMRYREYRAALGLIFALSILALKAFFKI